MGWMTCRACGGRRKVGAWYAVDDPSERVHHCTECDDVAYWEHDGTPTGEDESPTPKEQEA